MESKDYQNTGVEWLIEQEHKEKNKGGILADEMGLGKTIQIIATLICNVKKATLIIVPLTLIEQWNNQIESIVKVKPLLYHPTNNDFKNIDEIDAAITLTTYGMISKKKEILCNKEWDRVICDEAHHLRNHKSECYNGMMCLKKDITWLLTGTPIQNKKNDLISLFTLIGCDKHELKQKEIRYIDSD